MVRRLRLGRSKTQSEAKLQVSKLLCVTLWHISLHVCSGSGWESELQTGDSILSLPLPWAHHSACLKTGTENKIFPPSSSFISTENSKPNLILLSSNAKWFISLRCLIYKMPTVIQHLLQGFLPLQMSRQSGNPSVSICC